MSKNYRNSNNMSGRHNANSGNRFNVNNSGANSPINIILHNAISSNLLSPRCETEATSLNVLIREKLHKLILPALLSIADIVLWLVDMYFIDTSPWNIVTPLVMLVLFIIIAGLAGSIIKDLFGIMQFKNIGQTCYYVPKHQIILRLFVILGNGVSNTNTSAGKIKIQRVFKNETTEVFEIKGCTCTYCPNESIGYIRPRKWISNSIEYSFGQNTDYIVKLDCIEIGLK